MNYLDDAKRQVAALAEELENPDLALDDAFVATFSVEGVDFTLSYDAGRNCLFIYAPAGDLRQAADPGAVLEQVLAAGYLWSGTAGGILGLDDKRDELVFSYRLDFPLPGDDIPETLLCDLLPYFAGVIEWSRDLLAPVETA